MLDVGVEGANKDVYFYITGLDGKRVFSADRIYDGYHLKGHQVKSLAPIDSTLIIQRAW